MKQLLKIAIIAAAAYFAYDYFVVQGHWEEWKPVERKKREAPPDAKPEDFQRNPGRGLNPFTTEDMPGGGPARRPPMPKIPGAQ